MSYTITVSNDEQYIVGIAESSITLDVADKMRKEFLRQMKTTGIMNILIDVRSAANDMDVVQNYDYAYNQSQIIEFPKHARVAILDGEGDESHNFAETVANNAGYQVRVLRIYEDAIAWLTRER